MASDPPPASGPVPGNCEGGFIEIGFRVLRLLAVLLFVAALLLGAQARQATSVAPGTARPSAAHIVDDGSTTRVRIGLAGGENASRVVVVDPAGADVFEITCYRGGHSEVRCGDRRGTQATVTRGPPGGITFQMSRKGASPAIGGKSGGKFLEILWQEGRPEAPPGQVRVQAGRMSRDTPETPVKRAG